jgi:hypothetical protein
LPPTPLFRSVRAHRPSPRVAEAPMSSTHGLPASPPLLRRSRFPSRGEQLPNTLNSPCIALSSVQSLAGGSLRRRYATPPQTATLWCPYAGVVPMIVSVVSPRTFLCPSQRPMAPSASTPSSSANLRRRRERHHRWRSGNPARGCHWISGVHPRSSGLGLIRLDLISTVCFGSGRSGVCALAAPLPSGPACQPR